MERALPKVGAVWQHFKQKEYKIIACPVTHTETREQMICYQALYGDYGYFVRPLAMFMEPTDKVKYPEVQQAFRFIKKKSV